MFISRWSAIQTPAATRSLRVQPSPTQAMHMHTGMATPLSLIQRDAARKATPFISLPGNKSGSMKTPAPPPPTHVHQTATCTSHSLVPAPHAQSGLLMPPSPASRAHPSQTTHPPTHPPHHTPPHPASGHSHSQAREAPGVVMVQGECRRVGDVPKLVQRFVPCLGQREVWHAIKL